ncbi:MAG: GntR family transcriptional regulator [Promethearchaeota archaeon]|nr:MAG: GntR family transcriptional regulator [Candidatus Lokiarchaeota archaeon]
MKISKTPLYEKIYQFYREKILTEALSPQTQLPTEMDLMDKFDVSRITVVRALKELESNGYIQRIQGSGSYVTDGEWKKSLKTSSLAIISLVLPTDENFKPNFLKGIEECAKEHRFFVTFHQTTENPDSLRNVISEIISRGSQGIILYPADSTESMDLFSKLLIDKFPIVLIDRKNLWLGITYHLDG